jgi:hypothetical protein
VLREIIARRVASGVWRQGDDERGVVAGLAFAGGGLALVPIDGDDGAAGRDGGGSQAVNASSQRSFRSYSGAPGLPAVHHVDVDDLFYPLAYGRENRVLRLLADPKIVVTPAVRNR